MGVGSAGPKPKFSYWQSYTPTELFPSQPLPAAAEAEAAAAARMVVVMYGLVELNAMAVAHGGGPKASCITGE
ncbi:unnamed protein product [Lota lota]